RRLPAHRFPFVEGGKSGLTPAAKRVGRLLKGATQVRIAQSARNPLPDPLIETLPASLPNLLPDPLRRGLVHGDEASFTLSCRSIVARSSSSARCMTLTGAPNRSSRPPRCIKHAISEPT